jgi:multimeric flavodoxin WrbA
MMKIIGVSCSPRKGKTSFYALDQCLQAVKETWPELDTALWELADLKFGGCLSCGQCAKGLKCSQEDDFGPIVAGLADPEVIGLIVATPVYLGTMTSQCKAFLDRCVPLRRNGFLLRNKVGGVIAVGGVRNGGQDLTIQAVHASMLVQDMVIVSDGQPTAHFGGTVWSGHPEGVSNDSFGLTTARNLGKRVAEVALKLNL